MDDIIITQTIKSFDMDDVSIGGQERKVDRGGEGITDIPKNRTLVIDQLTSNPPIKPEIVEGLKNIREVFEHFQPETEVEFENEEGAPVKENLAFRSVSHFGDKGIIRQSRFLQDLELRRKDYQKFIRMLKSNKVLEKILRDPEAKTAYLNGLWALLQELEEADT